MKCAMGPKERAFRIGVGAAAAGLFLFGSFVGFPKVVLLIIAVAGIASGFLKFCPLSCFKKPKE